MSSPNTINLIRNKTTNSPQLGAIAASLRRSGYIGIIVFLSIGLLVGVLLVLFSQEEKNLSSKKDEYIKRVNSNKQAEGYFRSIKDRTRIVESTLTSIKPWTKLLDETTAVVPPPVLTNISVDEESKIVITVKTGTIDAILPVVNSLIAKAQANRFVNPQLSSFQIEKNGDIITTFSFTAVF